MNTNDLRKKRIGKELSTKELIMRRLKRIFLEIKLLISLEKKEMAVNIWNDEETQLNKLELFLLSEEDYFLFEFDKDLKLIRVTRE